MPSPVTKPVKRTTSKASPGGETTVLAGDIGGTKTNLALFRGPVHDMKLLSVRTYPSQKASSPARLVEMFMEDEGGFTVADACFGVAGPVVNNVAHIVNLPWEVSGHELRTHFNWRRASIINDLVALAYVVPYLRPEQTLALNDVEPPPEGGNIGILAAGTGLGQALLIKDEDTYVPCPSEGGHRDFAPRSDLEFRLFKYLAEKFGHVSVDRVLSGSGLTNLYLFLRKVAGIPEPDWLRERFSEQDPAAVVSETALAGDDPVCEKALAMFAEIYGAEAGNLALQGVTTGGMYIGGGIAPQIIDALKTEEFLSSFYEKGRLKTLLTRIPVRLILDTQAMLWGAAAFALKKSVYKR